MVSSLSAYAQNTPAWELYGGYQYARTEIGSKINMSGFNVSLQENSASWWGGIIDVSGSYRPVQSTTLAFYTFAGGPQFTYRRSGRLQPFTRIMFGGAHVTGLLLFTPTVNTSTAFALISGGGIDYSWKKFMAFRATGDYVRSYLFEGTQENNFRVSVGVDLRMGRK